jgi:predicted nucleotidyltransferase
MEIIDLLSSHAKEIKTGFCVKRIGLFGSFARGEHKEASDIDILVEFDKPTFRNFMDLSFLSGRVLWKKGGPSHGQGTAPSHPTICGKGCDLV